MYTFVENQVVRTVIVSEKYRSEVIIDAIGLAYNIKGIVKHFMPEIFVYSRF